MNDRRIVLALSILVAIGLFFFVRSHEAPPKQSTVSLEADPPLGVDCAIEMRPPLPYGYSSLHLKGKLRSANDKWLILYNGEKPAEGDLWIARESVLLIVTGKAARTYDGINLKIGQ